MAELTLSRWLSLIHGLMEMTEQTATTTWTTTTQCCAPLPLWGPTTGVLLLAGSQGDKMME